jgi:hypothetical protein
MWSKFGIWMEGEIKSPYFVKDNSGFQHESENNSQLYPKKLKNWVESEILS